MSSQSATIMVVRRAALGAGLLLVAGAASLAVAQEVRTPEANQQARAEAAAAIGQLAGKLKEQLGSALKAQGPAGAVGACKLIAPEVEAAVGTGNKLAIKRTALRVRNPANTPDAFEVDVLRAFVEKAANGADVATLTHSEVVDTPSGKAFRFMKAIPMASEPCAACHGAEIKPDVGAAIRELYPNDKATGYKPGEVRGAFSVTKPL